MSRGEVLQALPLMPHGTEGLLAQVADLRSMTDIQLSPATRAHLDRVLAEQYKAAELARHHLRPSNRLLFCGPPGCGKTVTAGGIALALGLPLWVARLDAIVGSLMGETSGHLRKIFDFASVRKVVLFLDEFDAVSGSRHQNNASAADREIGRVVSSLLTMLEESKGPSLIIAATNHEQSIDSAMWRRFDEVVTFPGPSKADAQALLNTLLIKHEADRPLRKHDLTGLSFADIERVALSAVKATVIAGVSIDLALQDAIGRESGRTALATPKRKAKR